VLFGDYLQATTANLPAASKRTSKQFSKTKQFLKKLD
jgi:hypothetical protein